MKKLLPVSLAALMVAFACADNAKEAKPKSDFYGQLRVLNRVMQEVDGKYVEAVDAQKVMEAAVGGLRTVLDPHTTVFNPKDFDRFHAQTQGEFGGLGIQIGVRDRVLTIIAPIQGTPAAKLGLQAGDRILKINGVSTRGITSDAAVDKLRGQIGTQVTVTIMRDGFAKPVDYVVTRARITIESVPYSGIVSEDVGYVQITQFQENTAADVERAVEALKAKGMKRLVLDLRYNPGGLLDQAIGVSELFLPKGSLIVSTKGRTQHTEAFSERDPIFDGPMAVLINEGSASASEIVSGALQDHDRAIVLGKTSFGKGSVQTLIPLDGAGNTVKLTTAFYYLPQGRCVNKPENGVGALGREDEEETEDTAASTKKDSTVTYLTKAGRKVFGGGGVKPDLEIEADRLTGVEALMERATLFFKYVVKLRASMGADVAKIDANWSPTDAQLADFKVMAMADTTFTKSKLPSEGALDAFRDLLKKEKNAVRDSSAFLRDEAVLAIESLRGILQAQRANALNQENDYVRWALKREMISAQLGEAATLAFKLKSDNQLEVAVAQLRDPKKYKTLLAPTKPKE